MDRGNAEGDDERVGTYVLANVDAGEWEVLVEKPGFLPATTKGIALRPRETVRVDLSLEIGQVVTEAPIVAQTQAAPNDMAMVMDWDSADALTQLPLNHRAEATNPYPAIFSTAPGAPLDSSGNDPVVWVRSPGRLVFRGTSRMVCRTAFQSSACLRLARR